MTQKMVWRGMVRPIQVIENPVEGNRKGYSQGKDTMTLENLSESNWKKLLARSTLMLMWTVMLMVRKTMREWQSQA